MDNPIETLGSTVEQGGKIAGEGLRGVAGFLNDLTGNALHAAIFAGFLLLFLSFFKATATSKNPLLYARATRKLSGTVVKWATIYAVVVLSLGLLGYGVISPLTCSYEWCTTFKYFAYNFLGVYKSFIDPYKWYYFIILAVNIAARVMESTINTISNENISTVKNTTELENSKSSD